MRQPRSYFRYFAEILNFSVLIILVVCIYITWNLTSDMLSFGFSARSPTTLRVIMFRDDHKSSLDPGLLRGCDRTRIATPAVTDLY